MDLGQAGVFYLPATLTFTADPVAESDLLDAMSTPGDTGCFRLDDRGAARPELVVAVAGLILIAVMLLVAFEPAPPSWLWWLLFEPRFSLAGAIGLWYLVRGAEGFGRSLVRSWLSKTAGRGVDSSA